MATKKKAPAGAGAKKKATEAASAPEQLTRSPQEEAFEKLLLQFATGVEAFNKGDYTDAKSIFDAIAGSGSDESVMLDRARSYSAICERRIAPEQAEPESAEGRYYRAVLQINQGLGNDAVRLLDQALQDSPTSSKYLYARASAWAIEGEVDKAVSDLRQAISVDPQVRFQAVNDPDFESIREEPAFIDIIEPTPSGV